MGKARPAPFLNGGGRLGFSLISHKCLSRQGVFTPEEFKFE